MSLIIQRDQEQELIIEKISELLKKEGWEVKSIFPYFHKNRTTVQVIIRKNYDTNSFPSFNEDDFKRMMKEIILLIWSALVTSGWWAIGFWGAADGTPMMGVAIITTVASACMLVWLVFHIVTNWD